MADEDVIRRRLLIDGDGTGDERRLNVLLKSFIKWSCSNDSPAASKIAHDRMLAQLGQCEFAVSKSRLIAKMAAAELENYENLSHQIENDISTAKEKIDKTKLELKDAKTVRRNRIEYDLLAKVINEQPDRCKTNSESVQLKKDLQVLQETHEQLERKLEMRRKQFHVMVAAIHQLEGLLDESDADEIMDVSLDDADMVSPPT